MRDEKGKRWTFSSLIRGKRMATAQGNYRERTSFLRWSSAVVARIGVVFP
jgi:hypothetical protein